MSSSVIELGRLERVALRDAWPDEASNFTPWLAEEANLNALGDALGLNLATESVEKQVGPFAADILAKDLDTQRWVIIENQIAPTDHTHLGQLLTYAAGLDARIIIWIAEVFRDQHIAALEFLNRATTAEYTFFGVQIELYRIGNSAPAPRFSIVAKPNDWNKQVQAAKTLAESEMNSLQKLNHEYWTSLIRAADSRYPALAQRSAYKTNGQQLETLKGGDPSCVLNAVFGDKGLRLEIYIDGSLAKAAFAELKEHSTAIETTFGSKLSWDPLPEARGCRIAFYMPGNEKREKRDRWGAQQDWILRQGPKFSSALKPFVAALDPARLRQEDEMAAANSSAQEPTPASDEGASS